MSLGELGEAWLEAWSGRDPQAFVPLCAVDVHYQDPLIAQPLQGARALGEHAAQLWASVPDARLEPAGPAPGRDGALALPWRLRGTHSRSLRDFPATGRTLALHGIFLCELDGGPTTAEADRRMRAVRGFFDLYEAGTQLGVLPARGTASERALLLLQGFGLRAGG